MSEDNDEEKILLPHHKQQSLCTTRLPYRQGRKLTAVKVYTINNESNHLLIFGVPSLNLRLEAKALFHKFGKLKSFTLAPEYEAEQFTETYHAVFEKIQSARMAKKMLDAKNFYGGSLHVTYAPELEDIEETSVKLAQRKYDVLARLRNLKKEELQPVVKEKAVETTVDLVITPKLNMGEENVIKPDGNVRKRKFKPVEIESERFQPCFVDNEPNCKESRIGEDNTSVSSMVSSNIKESGKNTEKSPINLTANRTEDDSNVEVIDCTSVDVETITNINEHLNVDKFDNIKVYKVPEKPVNKIKFYVNKNS